MIKSTVSKIVILSLLVIITNACKKKTYSINIINFYQTELLNVKIGPADFGTIPYNSTTGYQEVSEGANAVSATDSSKSIHSDNRHDYHDQKRRKNTGTLTFNSDGTYTFVVDKK